MSKISKRLEKPFAGDSVLSWLIAYGYAGIISCGPWIISISALAITNSLVRNILPIAQRDLFSTTTTYAYALSLIITGPLQLIAARYAGTLVSQGKDRRLFSSAIATLTTAGFLALPGALLIFGRLTTEPLAYKFAAVSLTVFVAMAIIAVVYLGACRHFHLILAAFLCGYAAGSVGAVAAAPRFGVPGVIFAFSAGHLVIVAILLAGLGHSTRPSQPLRADWGFSRLFLSVPSLALSGLFYNLGIWSDKFLFWWLSNHSIPVSGVLRASPHYDVAIYLSLLSIIPGFATMFFFLETDFAKAYHRFFERAGHGGSLAGLGNAKFQLMESIRRGLSQLISAQGVVTFSLLICASPLATWIGIGALQKGIFSVTLVGTCLLLIFLFVLTILFYLNDKTGALIATGTFFLTNTALSYFTLTTNEAWHGYGFLAASSLACLIAMLFANRACASLEYRIFRGEATAVA